MASSDCPPWIDPGSAFKLVVKVTKYVAVGEYGEYDRVDMAEQQHDLWFDRNSEYTLAQFHATRQVMCPNCKEYGHRGGSWKCSLTGTKKRKRTKKSNAQVGRKKANKGVAGDEAVTPRTRRAMAREAAAKARREAEEAELKAAAAREAAQAAAREEIEATRNELSAIHAQEDVLDVMPLEVHVQETTAARRTLFPEDELQVELVKKMTPRRKQLAKKVRKT